MMGDWQHFRMTGSDAEVTAAVDRLRQQGWTLLEEPQRGPLDTWTARVQRPDAQATHQHAVGE